MAPLDTACTTFYCKCSSTSTVFDIFDVDNIVILIILGFFSLFVLPYWRTKLCVLMSFPNVYRKRIIRSTVKGRGVATGVGGVTVLFTCGTLNHVLKLQ